MNVLPHQLIPDEVGGLIEDYLLLRVERREQRWNSGEQACDDSRLIKLVIILCGLPGSGKTMFALALALYAHAHQLRTATCSADDFFETPDGYNWNPHRLTAAHDDFFRRFTNALASPAKDVIIVDNTNVRHPEFHRYQLAAEADHFCQFVSFHCDSIPEARWQASRSLHTIDDNVIIARSGEYHRANTQMGGIWIEPTILEDNADQALRVQFHRNEEARALEQARMIAEVLVERERQRRRDKADENDRRWRARPI